MGKCDFWVTVTRFFFSESRNEIICFLLSFIKSYYSSVKQENYQIVPPPNNYTLSWESRNFQNCFFENSKKQFFFILVTFYCFFRFFKMKKKWKNCFSFFLFNFSHFLLLFFDLKKWKKQMKFNSKSFVKKIENGAE